MIRPVKMLLLLVVLAAAAGGGYWFGQQDSEMSTSIAGIAPASVTAPHGVVIYYRAPDDEPFYSLTPVQSPDGRAYRAVLASEDVSFDDREDLTTTMEQSAQRQILYYRHPMGLPDISPTPKKDSMGMDYIPVYAGEDDDSASIRISPGKVQQIGVRSESAQMRILRQPVRAPGTIQLDERRVAVITLRTEAFIDKVENVTTGSEVRTGQPLLHLYSPAITDAAAEYLYNLKLGHDAARLRSARQPLLNLAAPPDFINAIEQSLEVPLTFSWPSPRTGILLERNVVDGMRVMPGDVLFRIADHAVVWALVDVAERDLAAINNEQPVVIRVRSYPDQSFSGKIALIYPHLNPATRTVRVRIELANPDYLLRPDMYAEAEIDTGSSEAVLSVPDHAVIYSGSRQFVILDKGDGHFEHRPVRLGSRGVAYVQIHDGITEGDQVVVSANFLIDAESNLRSALESLTGEGLQP
jgi:membrane fusion protein, copper/silver efflux system